MSEHPKYKKSLWKNPKPSLKCTKDSNRHFPKDSKQRARCSISLVIRSKCQCDSVSRLLVSVPQKTRGNKLAGMLRKRNTYTLLVGTEMGTASAENVKFPQKRKRDLPYDPAVLLLVHIYKGMKSRSRSTFWTDPCVHRCIVTRAKMWKQPVSTDGWAD